VTDAATLVRRLSERLDPLATAAGEAWWRASTDVCETTEAARVTAELAFTDALADPDAFAALGAAAPARDPLVDRQVRVLRDGMVAHQVDAALRREIVGLEASIDATFNRFRGTLDGEPVADHVIADVLRTSDDASHRQAAWVAAKEVGGAVAADVRRLAHLRNRAARSLGYRDHFAMTLATSELDEDRLLATLDAVDDATRDLFTVWKDDADAARAARFGCRPVDLRPWHYDDPFFQAAPEIPGLDLDPWFAGIDQVAATRRTYAGIGFDIDPIVTRSDLLPRDRKSQHAFCIHVDRAGDVRVLSNNVPGEYWTETMLHEFGHAVYDAGLDPELPWSLRSMHPLTTEGVAMLFGRLSLDGEWLTGVAGVAPEEVERQGPLLARRSLLARLVFARWVLVMTNFERGLYADPDADHDTRWWDLVERFQLLRRPDDRHAPDWAAKIHVALAPVYYQNYLLGELVASQLEATLRERFGGIVDRPGVGEHLARAVFAPGWRVPWARLVADATGRPLGVEAFASELRALAGRAA
jgi:peptidyl-dipeptidase A